MPLFALISSTREKDLSQNVNYSSLVTFHVSIGPGLVLSLSHIWAHKRMVEMWSLVILGCQWSWVLGLCIVPLSSAIFIKHQCNIFFYFTSPRAQHFLASSFIYFHRTFIVYINIIIVLASYPHTIQSTLNIKAHERNTLNVSFLGGISFFYPHGISL